LGSEYNARLAESATVVTDQFCPSATQALGENPETVSDHLAYLTGREVETNRSLGLYWISNAAAKNYEEAVTFQSVTNR
jgi:hypothetical protein